LRVAAYVLVPAENDAPEDSLQIQEKHYDTTISANPNWEYVGLYADKGISRTRTHNRKGFQQMIDDCKAGKINLIVVKDVSRFAKNIVDCLNTVRMFLNLDHPVGVFFEDNNLNTLDASGNVTIELFAMFAELESDLRKRRAQWRKTLKTRT